MTTKQFHGPQSLIVSGDGPEGWIPIQARELAALQAQLAEMTAQRDELLAALTAMVKQIEVVHPIASTLSYGRAAIAKAEGRS